MNRWLTGMVFTLVAGCTVAQNPPEQSLTGYVYKRSSTPGIRRRIADEKTGEEKVLSDRKVTSWMIYLVYTGTDIKPFCVWIDGKAQKVQYQKVTTPVVISQQGMGNRRITDTLVRATNRTVIQVFPDGDPPRPRTARAGSRKATHVVVEYYLNGRRKEWTATEIKNLAPLILQ